MEGGEGEVPDQVLRETDASCCGARHLCVSVCRAATARVALASAVKVLRCIQLSLVVVIIIIIKQHLYSAMESEDTEALVGARLRHVKQMSF